MRLISQKLSPVKATIFMATVLFGAAFPILAQTGLTGGQTHISTSVHTAPAYTVLPTDCGTLLSFASAADVTVSLPRPGTNNLSAGCWMDVQNTGTGAVVLTPQSTTIDGQNSVRLTASQGVRLVLTPSSYLTQRGSAPSNQNGIGNCTLGGSNNDDFSCHTLASGDAALPGQLTLWEPGANGAEGITVKAPDSLAAGYSITLPAVQPNGQLLFFPAPSGAPISSAGTWVTPSFSLLSGTAAPSQLGSGTPDSTTFLRGDGTWTTPAISGGSVGSGASSISQGTFSNLPGTCSVGDMYLFTDSLYTQARCAAVNSWTFFYDGKIIAAPSQLQLSTLILQPGVTVSAARGYEQMVLPGGGSNSLSARQFTAPAAPYTRYLEVRIPPVFDVNNYRTPAFGWADNTGASEVMELLYGAGTFGLRIVTRDSAGAYTATAVPLLPQSTFEPMWGSIKVMLNDDGTKLNYGFSADGSSGWVFGSVGRTSFLASPSKIVYGGANSVTGSSMTIDLVGVTQ